MIGFQWSASEKKIARRLFETALEREHGSILEMTKTMAATATMPEDIWALHDYLSKTRREIDRKYDYRYSQLIIVFGRLLREKWISEQELAGLEAEKIRSIVGIARI